MTNPKKDRQDSLFWRVEGACADLLVRVAEAHAEAGGEAVVCTGRKLTPEQEGKLSFAGVKVLSTRREQ